MNIYDPKKTLISIHIPKCAGVALTNILKVWFNESFLTHYHNEIQNKPPKKHKLYTGFFKKKPRSGLCIHGHFNNNRGNGVRDYYPEVEQLITMIRNPFDLHLSNYFYVRKMAQSQVDRAYRGGKLHPIIENNWNLEDYLRNIKKSHICCFLPFDITLENYQQALKNQFLYIGISERLQNSVDILAKKLGFPTVAVPQTNISEWNEPIPDGAREEFEEANPLEMSIYRFANENWGNKHVIC